MDSEDSETKADKDERKTGKDTGSTNKDIPQKSTSFWSTLPSWPWGDSQNPKPIPEAINQKHKLKAKEKAKPIDHPLHQKIAVPVKLLEKQQSRSLLEELLRQCHYDLKMYPYDDTAPADHLIVVPCVNESRVGSDLGAAFQDACMNPAAQHRNVIVVLFMPKAKHVQEHTVSTFEKMGNEFKVHDMVDVYFWDDDIYKCDTNKKAQHKMQEILKGKDVKHKATPEMSSKKQKISMNSEDSGVLPVAKDITTLQGVPETKADKDERKTGKDTGSTNKDIPQKSTSRWTSFKAYFWGDSQSPKLEPESIHQKHKPNEKRKAAEQTLHQKIAVHAKLLQKQQNRPLLAELLRQCHYDLNKMCVYPSTAPPDHLIVVPCVNESRVGSDLGAAFQDADMDPATEDRNVIVVLFMPKAKHVPEHMVSTFEKMGDEFKVQDMVDVYFWDDDIYKCDTNDKAKHKMQEILKGKDKTTH